jgi:hypothetical protein
MLGKGHSQLVSVIWLEEPKGENVASFSFEAQEF